MLFFLGWICLLASYQFCAFFTFVQFCVHTFLIISMYHFGIT
eukprot:UN06260